MRKIVALLLLAVLHAAPSHAFPERPISFVVPQGAGGGTDRMARLLVPFMEKHLGDGASIAVLNKPGGGGYLGYTELALAKPDGHTIGFIDLTNLAVAPLVSKVRFDVGSFAFIGAMSNEPTVLAALKTRFTTLEDLLTEAKANPGTVSIAVPSLSNVHSIGVSKLSSAAGVTFNKVPLGDGGQAINAVLGGHADAVALAVSALAPHREQLALLGQMAPTRSRYIADAPTFTEKGIPITNSVYRVVAAPKDLPPATLQALTDALSATMADPSFTELAEKQNLEVEYIQPGEVKRLADQADRELRSLWQESPWVKAE